MGSRRAARRQDRHLPIRRPRPHRRGRRRLSHACAACGRFRPPGRARSGRSDRSHCRECDGVARRVAFHPGGDPARGPGLGPTVHHHVVAELAGQAAGSRRTVPPPHRPRRLARPLDPSPLRRRGPGSARRCSRRQHLRNRHRSLQPGRDSTAGRPCCQASQPAARRDGRSSSGAGNQPGGADLRIAAATEWNV